MVKLILRVLKSYFSLPVWVVIWLTFFLIPANFSGFFLLEYESGFWIALLGAGAICVNVVIVFINGGLSKVLAIPHLVFWIPLQIYLLHRILTSPEISDFEQNYILLLLVINGISLAFAAFSNFVRMVRSSKLPDDQKLLQYRKIMPFASSNEDKRVYPRQER